MEPANSPPMLKFGPYLADFRAGELRKNGARIRMQEKPLRVLALLAGRQGQLVTREELKKRLWPDDTFVNFEAGLNTAVGKLRDALSDNAGKPRYIQTIPRRGYRFIATATLSETATDGHMAHSSIPAEDSAVHSIAVLPFENLSHGASQDYLSDGMTDALITALSKAGRLRVISRTSVVLCQKAGKTLPVIARELGVEFIVEGSVLQIENRVRIAAQLIDGVRDEHVWAEKYDGDFSDMLLLLDRTALAVASAVAGRLQPTGALARTTRRITPEACQAYLKGRHEFYRFTEEGLWAAIDWYGKAIQADPNFALAYSAMAHAYCFMVAPLATLLPRELFGRAEAAARKALTIDDSNCEARWVLGMTEIMFHWNWKAGERETRLAIEMDPNNATARLTLAMCYLIIGEDSRAIDEAQQACLLDPLSPFMQSSCHAVMYHTRRYVELRKRMFSDRARLVGFFKYHLVLGMCEIHDRRWELAIEQLTIAVAASGGSSFIKAYLGYALAASGREIEARALFRELLMYAKSRYVPATDFAILAVGLGDKNEALDWLDKAYEERSTYLIFVAHDALFDPLRTEPRFQNLLHRVGLASLSPETPPLVNAVNQT
jgi:TolB-like protein/Flp pilus assembly protein TadD